MGILRKISFALTEAIFTVIPSVYDIFERIGSHEFFTSETIQYISNNIYILVSVCMLFAFGIKLINTIVNPDLVDDKKKGTGKTFINGIIAVVLISTIPFIFNMLYETQNKVIEDKLIQKIVFGTDGDYEPGKLLAGYAFGAFCYPNEEVSNQNLASSGKNYYNKVIKGEIQYISRVGDAINDEIDGEYELNYHIILSPLSGGYLLYQLILMCIDVAFRSVKLGILQLMAPLVICAFIFSGTELLGKWVKEVISTYILLFAKVAAITFMVYALSLLPDLFDRMKLLDDTRDTWAAKGFIRVAFIIALLQLVNKLPEIINSIFGTKLDTKDGGISGRLAAMAGVGGVASKAWDTFRRHPLQTAAKPAGVALGVGGNIANRMGTTAANLRQAAEGRGWGGVRQGAAILGGLVAGAATGLGTSIGAGRRGWNNGLAAAGREAALYRDTHQPGSNMWQRTVAGAARTLGFRTPYERASRNDEMVEYTDRDGNTQTMTVEQLNNLRSQHEGLVQRRSSMRDAIVDAIKADDSQIILTTQSGQRGTYSQLREALESFKASAPKRSEFQTQQAYENARRAYEQEVIDRDAELTRLRNNTRDAIMDYALDDNNIDADTGEINWRRLDGYTGANGTLVQGNVNGKNQGIISTNRRSLVDSIPDEDRGEQGELPFNNNATLDTYNRGHQDAMNDIDVTLQSHQQAIHNRHNSTHERAQQASQASVDARRNRGGGGGNSGGGNH